MFFAKTQVTWKFKGNTVEQVKPHKTCQSILKAFQCLQNIIKQYFWFSDQIQYCLRVVQRPESTWGYSVGLCFPREQIWKTGRGSWHGCVTPQMGVCDLYIPLPPMITTALSYFCTTEFCLHPNSHLQLPVISIWMLYCHCKLKMSKTELSLQTFLTLCSDPEQLQCDFGFQAPPFF